jgi:hypothetical protein
LRRVIDWSYTQRPLGPLKMLKKRPSSGYDKPRQPDASDLRVAASVVIKSRIFNNAQSKAKIVPGSLANRSITEVQATAVFSPVAIISTESHGKSR